MSVRDFEPLSMCAARPPHESRKQACSNDQSRKKEKAAERDQPDDDDTHLSNYRSRESRASTGAGGRVRGHP
jgi:hypothetical protein